MIRLALEWSSPVPSVAVERDGCVVAHASDRHQRFQARHAMGMVKDLVDQAQCEPEAISEILVGRGPGNYSGMRMAITIATGLALPGKVPVYALSSGRALMARLLAEDGSRAVRMAGDARRGSCWTCRADGLGPLVRSPADWTLHPMNALMSLDEDEPLRVSAEPERLTESDCWTPAIPDAVDLINLWAREGVVAEELDPLYLQPPV